MADNTLPQRI